MTREQILVQYINQSLTLNREYINLIAVRRKEEIRSLADVLKLTPVIETMLSQGRIRPHANPEGDGVPVRYPLIVTRLFGHTVGDSDVEP